MDNKNQQLESHFMTRIPWNGNGMTVISQSFWNSKLQGITQQFGNLTAGRCLCWHNKYEAAKRGGDAEAALSVIESVVSKSRLGALMETIAGREVTFIAPFVPKPSGGRNMLPITFAHFLAKRFGARVAEDVRQVARVGRKEMDSIDRLLHQPQFAGTIKPHTNYVMVDDSTKDGGTAATLRSFIEQSGGHVVCMATLANCAPSTKALPSNRDVQASDLEHLLTIDLAATSDQINNIRRKAGPGVGRALETYCHFGLDSLTRGEARIIEKYRNLEWVLARRSGPGSNAASPEEGTPRCEIR